MITEQIAPYTEEEAERMAQSFDAAWKYLKDSGSVFAQPHHIDRTRELLALKIIELVRPCPAEVIALRDEALAQLGFLPSDARCREEQARPEFIRVPNHTRNQRWHSMNFAGPAMEPAAVLAAAGSDAR